MPGAATVWQMPDSIAGYRLLASRPVRGAPQDTLHRFAAADTSINISVIRYAIPEYARVAPDSQAWTVREGQGFAKIQPVLKARGAIESFEQLSTTTTSTLRIGDRDVAEHAMAFAVRMRGKPSVEEQFLYIVRGRFLKVRASIPADRYPAMSVGPFARALARYLEIGQRP